MEEENISKVNNQSDKIEKENINNRIYFESNLNKMMTEYDSSSVSSLDSFELEFEDVNN